MSNNRLPFSPMGRSGLRKRAVLAAAFLLACSGCVAGAQRVAWKPTATQPVSIEQSQAAILIRMDLLLTATAAMTAELGQAAVALQALHAGPVAGDQAGVKVGGDGDTVTTWLSVGGLTMVATLLVYEFIWRANRRRFTKKKVAEPFEPLA